VIDKTGGLFRLAVGLLQSLATDNGEVDFSKLVNAMALYFQVRDDLVNLASEDYSKTKGFCEDFTEGKFSLPIIHALRMADEGPALPAEISSVLKQRTEDVAVLQFAQKRLRQAGSLAYCQDRCRTVYKDVVHEIQQLGGNPAISKIMEKLHRDVEDLDVEPRAKESSSPKSNSPK